MTDDTRRLKDCLAAMLVQVQESVARSQALRDTAQDPHSLGVAVHLNRNCQTMQRLLVEVGKELSSLGVLSSPAPQAHSTGK